MKQIISILCLMKAATSMAMINDVYDDGYKKTNTQFGILACALKLPDDTWVGNCNQKQISVSRKTTVYGYNLNPVEIVELDQNDKIKDIVEEINFNLILAENGIFAYLTTEDIINVLTSAKKLQEHFSLIFVKILEERGTFILTPFLLKNYAVKQYFKNEDKKRNIRTVILKGIDFNRNTNVTKKLLDNVLPICLENKDLEIIFIDSEKTPISASSVNKFFKKVYEIQKKVNEVKEKDKCNSYINELSVEENKVLLCLNHDKLWRFVLYKLLDMRNEFFETVECPFHLFYETLNTVILVTKNENVVEKTKNVQFKIKNLVFSTSLLLKEDQFNFRSKTINIVPVNRNRGEVTVTCFELKDKKY